MAKLPSDRPAGVTAGGKLRRTAIFFLIAGVTAGGVWLVLPHRAPETPAQTVPPPVRPPVPETPAPVAELPGIRENTPAPAADPEPAAEADVRTAAVPPAQADAPEVKPETPPAPPVRKGVPHPDDPADEAPYVARDSLEASSFASGMDAVRALIGESKNDLASERLRDLLKQTAFASAQYREGAKLLNELARAEKNAKEETEGYTVRPGDSLIRLARTRRISPVRLAAENGLTADAMLKIGQKLRVPKSPGTAWSIRISKRARLLRVWRGDELFAVYDVGIGRRDLTPEGVFAVRELVDDPPYPRPEGGMAPAGSPENQLGACWIGLGDRRNRATGYGIHGTPDETSVTKNLSAGCVRMRNKEVRELRSRIPVGTAVVIEK